MDANINHILEFAKTLSQRNSRLRIFVLSDLERSNDISALEQLPHNCQLIIRTFGDEGILQQIENPQRVFASCDARMAYRYGLSGIHIPNHKLQRRAPKVRNYEISTSNHNFREISRAKQSNADYFLISVAFYSNSPSAIKNSRQRPLGPIKIAQICRKFPECNFIALGGIDIKNYKRLENCGLYGVAGVSFKSGKPIQL